MPTIPTVQASAPPEELVRPDRQGLSLVSPAKFAAGTTTTNEAAVSSRFSAEPVRAGQFPKHESKLGQTSTEMTTLLVHDVVSTKEEPQTQDEILFPAPAPGN